MGRWLLRRTSSEPGFAWRSSLRQELLLRRSFSVSSLPAMKAQRGEAITVKKYSNRRLYDTSDSRYITLEELAEKIRGGREVQVIDAKSGDDLTQATLAQIILESRRAARLLPVPLLMQLIRMGDDALSEFFSGYMSWALDIYLQARQGAKAFVPFNPFASLPFSGGSAFARMFSQAPWSSEGRIDPSVLFERRKRSGRSTEDEEEDVREGDEDRPLESEKPEASTESNAADDLAELRREVEALKQALKAAK